MNREIDMNETYEIHSIENEIFFNGQINLHSMSKLTIELVKMEKKYKSIYLHINSSGGSATDSLSVYDLICSMKIPVYTICMGQTCSAGTIISMAGKIRYITPNTYMLIHQVTIGNDKYNKFEEIYKTKAKEIEKEKEKQMVKKKENDCFERLEKYYMNVNGIKPYQEMEDLCNNDNKGNNDNINQYDLINIFIKNQVRYNIAKHIMDCIKNIYLKHTKIKENEIDQILLEEGVFNANECLDIGLADQIFKREYIIDY
jgi:ATP-dependent protease ClpP protease subunit